MNKKRCPWVNLKNDAYVKYHDSEWGRPVYDDKVLFEFLILESAQAGLSWETILNKRKGYKKHFANFNYKKVATFSESDVSKLLGLKESEIIRNEAKIRSAITNAKKFLEVQKEFGGFSNYGWRFVGGKPIVNKPKNLAGYKTTSKEAKEFSRDLKKRGFSFLGETTIYAFMQAVGMVNDHSSDCFITCQLY